MAILVANSGSLALWRREPLQSPVTPQASLTLETPVCERAPKRAYKTKY